MNILLFVWLHISQLISVVKNFQVKSLSCQRFNNLMHNNSKEESDLCECPTSEELEILFFFISDQETKSLL